MARTGTYPTHHSGLPASTRSRTDIELAAEEWRQSTPAGRVFNVLFLLSLLVAIAVLFLAGLAVDKPFSLRNPSWDISALLSALLHYGSLGFVAGYMGHLKKTLPKADYQKIDNRVSYAYGFFILFLWLVPAIVGLAARPNCDPDSDWWKGFVAHARKPDDLDPTTSCHLGIAVVVLSSVNTVILSITMMASLVVRFTKEDHDPPLHGFVQRMLWGKQSKETASQDVEAQELLAQLDP